MKLHGRRTLEPWLICVLIAAAGPGLAQDALCVDGYAALDSRFATGVTVHVGPPHASGFAQKACAASLTWDKEQLEVAADAAQIDVDLLGADVGLNTPVAAFQIRQADGDTTSSYRIYSLAKPPRLLRTVTGAANFSAADVGLDGRVAIWADDAGAWDGIEGLGISSFAVMPMMALRFEDGKLVDAGAEFQSQFDAEIARARGELDPAAAKALKESIAGNQGDSAELMQAKARVLGLVWLFLYSGREADAWKTLEEYWPAKDLEPIRGKIRARLAKGIRSQLDGISTHVPTSGEHKKKPVYDQTERAFAQAGMMFENKAVDKIPQGIRLKRPDEGDGAAAKDGREYLLLTVDEAGKVRNAEMVAPAVDEGLVAAAKDWKFIPAFRAGRPVACRFKMYVAPYR